MAGANSIFYGDKLLTTENPNEDGDRLLMAKLDLVPLAYHAESGEAAERLPENYHTAGGCGGGHCGCAH